MKKGLSFERHVEIGTRLLKIRQELLDLWVELERSYPKHVPCVKALQKMMHIAGTSMRCDVTWTRNALVSTPINFTPRFITEVRLPSLWFRA